MDSALTFKAISGGLVVLIWLTTVALLWISMTKEWHLGQPLRGVFGSGTHCRIFYRARGGKRAGPRVKIPGPATAPTNAPTPRKDVTVALVSYSQEKTFLDRIDTYVRADVK